ncbi:MAG: hypothetical protein D6732_21225 [Methanobacteriota archaeon]|nr:MAG: hypothetical protein D6732_21225 [Euryarchaeota archaeon]
MSNINTNDNATPIPQSLRGWLTGAILAVIVYIAAYTYFYPQIEGRLMETYLSRYYTITLNDGTVVYAHMRTSPVISTFDTIEAFFEFSQNPGLLGEQVDEKCEQPQNNYLSSPPTRLRFRLDGWKAIGGNNAIWRCMQNTNWELCEPQDWLYVDVSPNSIAPLRTELALRPSDRQESIDGLGLDVQWLSAPPKKNKDETSPNGENTPSQAGSSETSSGNENKIAWIPPDKIILCKDNSQNSRIVEDRLRALSYSIFRKLLLPPWGNGILLLLALVITRYVFETPSWPDTLNRILTQLVAFLCYSLYKLLFTLYFALKRFNGSGDYIKRSDVSLQSNAPPGSNESVEETGDSALEAKFSTITPERKKHRFFDWVKALKGNLRNLWNEACQIPWLLSISELVFRALLALLAIYIISTLPWKGLLPSQDWKKISQPLDYPVGSLLALPFAIILFFSPLRFLRQEQDESDGKSGNGDRITIILPPSKSSSVEPPYPYDAEAIWQLPTLLTKIILQYGTSKQAVDALLEIWEDTEKLAEFPPEAIISIWRILDEKVAKGDKSKRATFWISAFKALSQKSAPVQKKQHEEQQKEQAIGSGSVFEWEWWLMNPNETIKKDLEYFMAVPQTVKQRRSTFLRDVDSWAEFAAFLASKKPRFAEWLADVYKEKEIPPSLLQNLRIYYQKQKMQEEDSHIRMPKTGIWLREEILDEESLSPNPGPD